jgi:flavodoxin
MSIVYFSRTHKTQNVAKKLGQALNLGVYQIKDDKNWKGFFGFIKGGFYASTNKPVRIEYDQEALDSHHIFVLSPVWASGPAPAVRVFLNENKDKNMTLVYTCDGSNLEKVYENSRKLFPHVKNYYGITHRLKDEDKILERIVKAYKED